VGIQCQHRLPRQSTRPWPHQHLYRTRPHFADKRWGKLASAKSEFDDIITGYGYNGQQLPTDHIREIINRGCLIRARIILLYRNLDCPCQQHYFRIRLPLPSTLPLLRHSKPLYTSLPCPLAVGPLGSDSCVATALLVYDGELPGHLRVVLRWVATTGDRQTPREISEDCKKRFGRSSRARVAESSVEYAYRKHRPWESKGCPKDSAVGHRFPTYKAR
jgi:hypothetical protein